MPKKGSPQPEKVRARVWSTGQYHKPRGPHRATGLTWHYAVVRPDGAIVLYDNTGHFEPMLEAALIRVEALRHMVTAGHALPSYRAG
jgi:hypothetical protein